MVLGGMDGRLQAEKGLFYWSDMVVFLAAGGQTRCEIFRLSGAGFGGRGRGQERRLLAGQPGSGGLHQEHQDFSPAKRPAATANENPDNPDTRAR